MKILLYGINFSPELTGIGKYTGEMAGWLAAHGHEVRVVTAPPYYPEWKVGGGFKNAYCVEDIRGGGAAPTGAGAPVFVGAAPPGAGTPVFVGAAPPPRMQVWRCPLWVPARPGGLKRLLHLASFAVLSLPVMLRQIFWRPDVVWVVEPALFCAPAAVAVARLSGAQAWLHVQDFEVDAAFALGLLRGAFLRRMVAGTERWLMRRFDVVSTISQRMHQRLLDKGVAPERAVLAPNWVDISAITPGGNDVGMNFRAQLGISPDAVVALYSGNMGAKQGLELLADLARLCLADSASNMPLEHEQHARAAIIFVFCGNGAGRADLVQRCAGLPNVHFLDLQPIERLNELLAMANIHLLPQRADAADLVMPSKLTGMLASGRPVVATALPATELDSVVTGAGCGLVVPPGDAQAFADAVQMLANAPELREQMGRAGRIYAETHLDRDAVLQQFEARLMLGRRSALKNAS